MLAGVVAAAAAYGTVGLAALAGVTALVVGGYLALRRFSLFVLLLLVIRPALDVGRVGPAVGIGFLAVAVAWLFVRWRARSLWELSPVGRALVVFAGVCVASAAWSPVPGWSLAAGMRVLSVALMFVVLEQLVLDDPANMRRLLVAPLISLAIPAAFAVQQLITGPSQGAFIEVGRIQGSFNHPNPFASYLVVVVLCAYGLHRVLPPGGRQLTMVMGLLATALVVFTYARVAWVALILALMVMIMRDSRRLVVAFLCIVVLVVASVPSIRTRLSDLDTSSAPETLQASEANSLAWRVDYWQRLAPGIGRLPLTGSGLESTQRTRTEQLQPHNTYLQLLLELGLVGALSFGWVVVTLVRRVRFLAQRARTDWQRAVLSICVGVGTARLLGMFTENLVTVVAVLWYVLVPFAVAAAPVAVLANGPQALARRRREMSVLDLGRDRVATAA